MIRRVSFSVADGKVSVSPIVRGEAIETAAGRGEVACRASTSGDDAAVAAMIARDSRGENLMYLFCTDHRNCNVPRLPTMFVACWIWHESCEPQFPVVGMGTTTVWWR